MLRLLAFLGAAILLLIGSWLGYVAVIAMRRSEGVFVPAGYVALLCLAVAGFLVRFALK
jgi:hypothetical protein